MTGSDGKLCFREKETGKACLDCMEGIMSKNDIWDHDVEGDVVEGPAVCVGGEEVLQALNLMKTGEAPGPLEVSLVLIVASVGVEFK